MNNSLKYSVGLDIGITSIGWAIVDEENQKIIRSGVRLFEAAEHPKDGKALAEPRRIARSTRRRLRRRSLRKKYIQQLFVEYGLLTKERIQQLLKDPVSLLSSRQEDTSEEPKHSPYRLRAEGLDRLLSNDELFLALYHIFNRRGYKSARKKVEETSKDTGPVLSQLKENSSLLQEKKYRTPGEMLYKDPKFKEHRRNKGGAYTHTMLRSELSKEIEQILNTQKSFGNAVLTEEFKDKLLSPKYKGSFNWQLSFASGNDILNKVGRCTFEKKEYRAAKNTYSFQLFSFLAKCTHMRIIHPEQGERALSQKELGQVLEFAHTKKEVTYKQLRKLLHLDNRERFNGLRYGGKEDEEKSKIGSLSLYYEVKNGKKKVMLDGKLTEKKEPIVSTATWEKYFEGNLQNLDILGTISTLYKTDADVRKQLQSSFPDITKQEIDELSNFDFSGFGHLSLTAIRKINQHLREGLTYDKACEAAGYEFKGHISKKQYKLKPLTPESKHITNPVVRRAVSQTIKVINAIIDTYGSPYKVKIECARDMSRNHKERKTMENSMKENQKRNEATKKKIEEMGHTTSPHDIVRYKLWEQQGNKCAYSLQPIDASRLFEDNYTEVDHIIPFSRSGDDSYNNKVLVLKQANQDKINRTPYEWFGQDTARWEQFEAFVNSLHLPYPKKQNLLNKKYEKDGWNARALNDTRYITKFLKNYIEDGLLFSEGTTKRRVIVVNGTATAYLRKRWGLSKIREENVLHHAVDAAVVAVIGPSLVQRISHFAKIGEVRHYLRTHKNQNIQTVYDPETGEYFGDDIIEEVKESEGKKSHFPKPWDTFTQDVETSISQIFVSRMPRRKVSGQAHLDTLRSPKWFSEQKSYVKKSLSKVKLKDLELMKGKENDQQVYETLKKRLEQYKDDPVKAFVEPVYKYNKHNEPIAEIKTIKVINTAQNSGYLINDGKALVDNGGMVRVDIFSKEIKGKKNFFAVPIYPYHTTQENLPRTILPGGKEVDETYKFLFSVYPNDLIQVIKGIDDHTGYFVRYHTGEKGKYFALLKHDGVNREEKKSNPHLITKGITTLETIRKYQVDILGNRSIVKSEKRLGFTQNP